MKNTSPQERKQVESVEIQQKTTRFSGPLPPPAVLSEYDKAVPGAAERIISMAECEMQHRHETEDKTTKSVINTTIVSITLAFVCVLILSGLVFYALYKGYPTVAGVIATGAIAAVAGVFINHTRKKNI